MPVLRKAIPVLACLALPLALNDANAEDLLDTKPLLKETVAGNAGLELIVPSIAETLGGNDYPTKLTTKFKVFAVGTSNKLFATPQKKFTPPARPCGNPIWEDWDWDIDFVGENNSHTAMALSFYAECQTNGGVFKEAVSSYLYVGDTSQAGSGWAKTWNKELVSVDIVDWDDDQQDEIKIILGFETNTQEKIKVVFLDKLTGTVESDRTYVIVDVMEP